MSTDESRVWESLKSADSTKRYHQLSETLSWMPFGHSLTTLADCWLAAFYRWDMLPDGIDHDAVQGAGPLVIFTWNVPNGLAHVRLAGNGIMLYRLVQGQRSTVKQLPIGTTPARIIDLVREAMGPTRSPMVRLLDRTLRMMRLSISPLVLPAG